jgi:hypothetical protein
MQNHPLGRTGLFVSELCLGTMTFGGGEGIWDKIGQVQHAWSARRWTPASTSSTPPTCTPADAPSRSPGRR